MEVSGQLHALVALTPARELRNTLCRQLGGPHRGVSALLAQPYCWEERAKVMVWE